MRDYSSFSLPSVFTLAMLSSTGFLRFNHTRELKDSMRISIESILCDSRVEKACGKWNLVWGPALYNHKKEGRGTADNAAFMAVSPIAPRTLVISLAGTNPISEYAWTKEDFAVETTVPWPVKGRVRPDLRIASGAFLGLTHTLSLADGGRRFLEALKVQVHSFSINRIIITGHSLGGTLTTVVSAWLRDNPQLWAAPKKVKILAYAFASPCIGTKQWAGRLNRLSRLPGFSYHRIWNYYDIVPYAWSRRGIQSIPALYMPDIEPGSMVISLVRWALARSREQDYVHVHPEAPCFRHHTGEIDDLQLDSRSIEEYKKKLKGKERFYEIQRATKFINRVVFEHLTAYFIHFQLEDVLKVLITHSVFARSHIAGMIAGFRILRKPFRFDSDYSLRLLCRLQGKRPNR